VGEQWKSFKELLKLKERLKLELRVNRPSRKRKRMTVFVGHDNYRIDAQRKVLHLGYWNIEVAFKGELRWLPQGKQGRLIIVYDPMKGKWYARVSVEVSLQPSSIPELKAGVDLGREIMAAVAVEDGHALLYRGGPLKSEYYYHERKIAEIDRALADPKSEEVDRSVLREKRRWLYSRMKRRREQTFANLAAHMARMLADRGVSVVFVGYPRNIAREKPGKGNSNAWSYWELITRMSVTLENYGIALFEVPENGTSKTCARHGCEVVRMPRGLVKCPCGHVMHADVNAALNILARGARLLGFTVELPKRLRVLGFVPTPKRIIERKRKAHNPAV
jgi:putative transposase